MKIYNFKKIFLALSVVLVFTGCKKDEAVVAKETIDVKFTANPDLSLFQYAIKKARLTNFTQGNGPFTIFAPTNAAFNTFGIADEAGINLLDSNALVQLITFHIQSGSRTYVEIPFGPNAPMSTQGGFVQYATRYNGGSAFINGAKIIKQDIAASNGTIHIIDKVLQVPVFNALTVLSSNPNYARMVQAINKASITSSFTVGASTFFAVPNSAMIAAGYDSTSIANLTLPASVTLLGNIMRYHVVPQRIFQQDFKAGNLKTLQGSNILVSIAGTTINLKGLANPSPFQIVTPSVTCINGVVYGIDGLLKY